VREGNKWESLMFDEQEIEQWKIGWDLIDWMGVKNASSFCNVNQLEERSDKIRLKTYEEGREYSMLGAQ